MEIKINHNIRSPFDGEDIEVVAIVDGVEHVLRGFNSLSNDYAYTEANNYAIDCRKNTAGIAERIGGGNGR